MQNNNPIRVALVDDHLLVRDAIAGLVNAFGSCKVTLMARSGMDLIQQITDGSHPDVILLDMNMPELGGYDTAKWLQDNRPEINVIMLTMFDSELSLIRLLQAGVKGFLKKDIQASELKQAIESVMHSGFYYSHNTTGKLVNLFRKGYDTSHTIQKSLLNETEVDFLRYACTEYTYKEIAQHMKLNPRSIDNLRDNLFTKLDVKSRVGLAMYSIRHGIVNF